MSKARDKLVANRLENLRVLAARYDGPIKLAKVLGYANASFIVQMCGPNPTRGITEGTARTFEEALGLEPFWLDKEPERNEDGEPIRYVASRRNVVAEVVKARREAVERATVKATTAAIEHAAPAIAPLQTSALSSTDHQALMTSVIKLLGRMCEDEGVAPAPVKFSELVALAYLDASTVGVPRESHIRSLVKLMK